MDMGASVFVQGQLRGMTDEAIRIVEDCGILFKGPMETPKGSGGKSINVTAELVERVRELPRLQTSGCGHVFAAAPGMSDVDIYAHRA